MASLATHMKLVVVGTLVDRSGLDCRPQPMIQMKEQQMWDQIRSLFNFYRGTVPAVPVKCQSAPGEPPKVRRKKPSKESMRTLDCAVDHLEVPPEQFSTGCTDTIGPE